jgi:hypothetical protein
MEDGTFTVDDIPNLDPPTFEANPLKPSIYFTDTNVIIQALGDISCVSTNSGISINVFSSIKATSDLTVETLNQVIETLDSCCHSSIQPIQPMSETGASNPVLQVPSNFFPYVDPNSEVLFNFENFNLNGGTVLTA